MSTKRNPGRPSLLTDDVLDAALACVLAVGVRRTTLSDVARRLGTSRPTLYRRWPDIGSLIADVMTRELARAVRSAADVAPRGDSVGGHLVASALALRDHPLLHKVIDVDPEWLLPYLLHRRGASQDTMLEMISATIAAGQSAGQVRDGDPGVLARTVLLALQSFMLSGRTMTEGLAEGDLDTELRHMIDRYLSPDSP